MATDDVGAKKQDADPELVYEKQTDVSHRVSIGSELTVMGRNDKFLVTSQDPKEKPRIFQKYRVSKLFYFHHALLKVSTVFKAT